MKNYKKLFKLGFLKREKYFFWKSKKAFEIENEKLYAFLPEEFIKFNNVDFSDEISPNPFVWKENIPKFRFKAEVLKIDDIFLNKYIKYLEKIQYNIKQKKFHIVPNFILKNWKTNSVPKIYDFKDKKEKNYHEKYFVLNIPNNNKEIIYFIEIFSSKIENFISNLSFKNHEKTKKTLEKDGFLLNFVHSLFSSRNQYIFELSEYFNKKIKQIKNKKDKYFQYSKYFQHTLPIFSFITKQSIGDNLGFDVSFNYLYFYSFPKNLPLSNINYFFQIDVKKDLIFGGFLIKPNEIIVITDKLIEKDDKYWKIIIDTFINKCYYDERTRIILYNDKTDKIILNTLKKNDNYKAPIIIPIYGKKP